MSNGTGIFLVIIVFVFFGWLLVLTLKYIALMKKLRGLKIESGDDLDVVAQKVLNTLGQMNAKYEHVLRLSSGLHEESQRFVHKIVLKRFNPFDDAGGDQSFSLALMDKKGSGVILSSLHGRSGTRIYAKPIKEGKELNYELSKEERDVLNVALKS